MKAALPEIERRYNAREPVGDIAKSFGVDINSLSRFLKRNGVAIRSARDTRIYYTVDESFFDVIDTEERAYALGFWYADGSNFENKGRVEVNQAIDGIDVLHKILAAMKCDVRLWEAPLRKQAYNKQRMFRMSISNPRLSRDLAKHGCTQNKTFTTKMPAGVPDHLMRHFIRGCWDGDGSISVTSGFNGASAGLTGTQELLHGIRDHVQSVFPSIRFSEYKRHKDRNNNTTCIRPSDRKSLLTLLHWMYWGATIYMDRKHEKYIQVYNLRILRKQFLSCR